MKKIRLLIITALMAVIFAFTLTACQDKQSNDITGEFTNGNTVYIFAEDGSFCLKEDGAELKGTYYADNGALTLIVNGIETAYDYTIKGDEFTLFKKHSLFGTVFKRTGHAPRSFGSDYSAETTVPSSEEVTTSAQESTEAVTNSDVPQQQATQTPNAPVDVTEPTAAEGGQGEEPTAAPTQPETQAPETTPAPTEPETTTPEPTTEPFVNECIDGVVEVGNTIRYGHYEQDNNKGNGKEAIEWTVIKTDGNRALLVSNYILDCQPYDKSGANQTWAESSLRSWLNATFINDAFSAQEQEGIAVTAVPPDPNANYDFVYTGELSYDFIYCLSTAQAYMYYPAFADRCCIPTKYAIALGVTIGEEGQGSGGNWWLRTQGSSSDNAAIVNTDGTLNYAGTVITDSNVGVRPVMWIYY